NPLSVIGGVLAQFIVMPLAAFIIAYQLNLPAELAAGLVLLGSVPGGTASNVMVYLARGNLPLSITMTSFSTMLAPIFTPLLLLLFARQCMLIDPISMFMSIVHVFIVRRLMPLTVDKSIAVVPLISVIAIIIIVSAVVSGNVDAIANGGFIVFIAVVLHNGVGLLIGYFSAKLMRLTESERRAISIE